MQRTSSSRADRVRRGMVVALVAALGLPPAAIAAGDDVTPFLVRLPAVTGPIPSTPTNFGFGIEGFDIMPPVPRGYVVEEFFVSGTGNIYEYTPTGIRVVSPCPPAATTGCTGVPYTTRMVVKRPRDRRDFSGTVIVEPLNPSGGFDIAAVWDRGIDHFVRNGDIFIGWSSKSVIVNALKNWNPTRYAPLHWPYLPPTPGSNNGASDGITFDIAAQIGALVRDTRARSHPLHGYRVKHVIESGFSQDGGFTFTQASFFHHLARLPGGRAVYDGYLPMGTNGPSNINFGLTPAGALPASDPRRAMQPRSAPVIHIDTETEIVLGALNPVGLNFRRPDSDDINDRYRLWEVPGASHVSADNDEPVTTLQLDSAQIRKLKPTDLPPSGCAHAEFVNGPVRGIPGVINPNNFPFSAVQNAGFERLIEWIEHNRPPPRAPRIEVDMTATPRVIKRDPFGNALGGLRTPFVDVPITTFVPTDSVGTPTPTSVFCILNGYNVPFDKATLASLYRNHAVYVTRVAIESARLVREGFWLVPDAIRTIEKAIRADVP